MADFKYDKMLDGKTAWITGGASRPCDAYARLFNAHGAKLVVIDDLHADGAALCRELADQGGNAVFRGCNLRETDRLADLCMSIISEIGAPDIYLHVADVYKPAFVDEAAYADITEMFDVSVSAPYAVIGVAAAPMAKKGGGSVVFVGGHYGVQSMNRVSGYGAAKGAQFALARALAAQYRADNIRVNAVAPGAGFPPVADDILARSGGDGSPEFWRTVQPVCRRGEMRDLADAALFLASDMSARVNGEVLLVDGAEHLVAHNHYFPRRDTVMP